jgi:hypothetical protein
MAYIVVGTEGIRTFAWGPFDTVEEASAVSVAYNGRPYYYHARVVELGNLLSAEALAALTEVKSSR